MVEGNDAEFAFGGPFGHLCNLVVNGGLHALHAGNISHIRLAMDSLVRSIAKPHQVLHSLRSVPLYAMLSNDLFANTHRAGYVYSKYHSDILAH